MYITISVFALVAAVILSIMLGFWLGRSVRWMMIETESRVAEQMGTETEDMPLSNGKLWKDKGDISLENKQILHGWSIGSPTPGEVRSISEGSKRGALIRPEQGKLYAPASGKITRLYPMGNAMILRTDEGVELMLRAGEVRDDLFSSYYRSYVVQNEVVTKGKLLLEFDRAGLRKEGLEVAVAVMVENGSECDVMVTQKEQVKMGEELLHVQRISCQAAY